MKFGNYPNVILASVEVRLSQKCWSAWINSSFVAKLLCWSQLLPLCASCLFDICCQPKLQYEPLVEADWYGWLNAQGILGNYSHSWRRSYKSRPGCISKFPRWESALPWKVIEIIPLIKLVMLMMHLDRLSVITLNHTWIQRLLSGLFPKSTQLAHSKVSGLRLHKAKKASHPRPAASKAKLLV